MRGYLVTFFVALILGIAGGFALGIFVYPYIFLADIVADMFNAVNKELELGLIGERDADATIEAMVVEGDKVLASI